MKPRLLEICKEICQESYSHTIFDFTIDGRITPKEADEILHATRVPFDLRRVHGEGIAAIEEADKPLLSRDYATARGRHLFLFHHPSFIETESMSYEALHAAKQEMMKIQLRAISSLSLLDLRFKTNIALHLAQTCWVHFKLEGRKRRLMLSEDDMALIKVCMASVLAARRQFEDAIANYEEALVLSPKDDFSERRLEELRFGTGNLWAVGEARALRWDERYHDHFQCLESTSALSKNVQQDL
jgi:hypothetical protein